MPLRVELPSGLIGMGGPPPDGFAPAHAENVGTQPVDPAGGWSGSG
jgi:hypothetical protein